ncbi:glucosaminidase domain-containing protein [Salinimicrobium oceani]|uniref:Peptidoglycan hydrolase n=1 Tax=Salinimicrobium oceani TaxID=2722702 RepID=A0ABX1D4V1_9FLAO|nr:glucosaminidase domain-containing protein [Salinimicrobium oceani]NJW53576.1 LysM peptidoglycan-binding domain-containing protein [Salinimicrobium oceani]
MKAAFRYLMLLLLIFTVACGTGKKVTKDQQTSTKKREVPAVVDRNAPGKKETQVPAAPKTYGDKILAYVQQYAPIAQEEMQLYKIPASITLAQGILESGAGEGELTLKANNHFGIKCHGWSGGSVYHDDDESQECFRKYKDPKYSYRDHSLFLTERKRYAALFDLDISDYKGWAHGLRAAGYATDRKYPDKLISLIERYQLYLYDGDAPAREIIAYSASNASESYRTSEYRVQKGDTLYSIAKRHNLTVEQLQRINNLQGTNIGIGQTLLVTP